MPSPGARLRQAREALGMEVASLAQHLHLSKSMVQALEEENYDILPARVFVRGYYRNYARLVNVPEEVVLSEFEKRCPEGEDCSVPPAVAQGVKKEIRSSHGLVRLVSWLVVIALLTTFGLWWKSNLDKKELSAASDSTGMVLENSSAKPTPAVTADTQSASDDNQAQNTEISEPDQPSQTLPREPAVVDQATASQAAAMDNHEDTKQPEQTASAGVPEPVPSEPVAGVSLPRVILSFKGDCWVDVRGAKRSFKVVGKRTAGDTIELTGEPPYKMVLGNARNVSVLVNGKPYDLAPHTRGNVAKLTLNPTAE
ncbi:conserved hypothetical protein [Thiolapillus brandeum]|uniref:Cytoskeleton protein RodZ-like C-terminal domain-containing protein n=1 Tax=Thiolapillus brandeum TaxID=1076588 RepID=A0A7U6JII0_9GAMM|nr:conserved hypothetical protein [Thiolapillus brandeum]